MLLVVCVLVGGLCVFVVHVVHVEHAHVCVYCLIVMDVHCLCTHLWHMLQRNEVCFRIMLVAQRWQVQMVGPGLGWMSPAFAMRANSQARLDCSPSENVICFA